MTPYRPCPRILACLVALALMPLHAEERVDLNAIHKIREEASQNSKVMDHVFQLTDVYGPRLTNSPGFFAAAGCAVMIEALRILKTLDLPLDRTVRMALWSGEEQSLLGSRAYVDEHFANREDMKLKPEHTKLAGYFNVDNASGTIRGVYLQGNDAMRPVFEAWFKPLSRSLRKMAAEELQRETRRCGARTRACRIDTRVDTGL